MNHFRHSMCYKAYTSALFVIYSYQKSGTNSLMSAPTQKFGRAFLSVLVVEPAIITILHEGEVISLFLKCGYIQRVDDASQATGQSVVISCSIYNQVCRDARPPHRSLDTYGSRPCRRRSRTGSTHTEATCLPPHHANSHCGISLSIALKIFASWWRSIVVRQSVLAGKHSVSFGSS